MTIPLSNIGGLASGLDTNTIIDQLIQIESIPLQQLELRRSRYEAKDAAWSQIVTRFSALQSVVDQLMDPESFAAFGIGTASSDAVTVTSVTDATPTTAVFTIDALAAAHVMANDATFAAATTLVGVGVFTINVAGIDHLVTSDATTTLEGLAQMINLGASGINASVLKVDDTTYRLQLTSPDTGAAEVFTASGTQVGMGTSTIVQQAADAQITIGEGAGAITITRDSNTVTDLVNGVTLTLNKVTTAPVTVTVTRDVDAAVAAVEDLIKELNAVMGDLKKATAYNAASNSAAILQGDATARSLATGLRSVVSDLYDSLSGNFTFASSVGITLTREGLFELDVSKLREKMTEEFSSVAELFEGDGSVEGLAGAIDDFLDIATGSDGSIQRARDRWQTQIDHTIDAIRRMEDRVDRREAALIRQFARLETAMAQLTGLAAVLASALPKTDS